MNVDRLILDVDKALRVIAGVSIAARANPATAHAEAEMDGAQRRLSAGLMRVNHVGEVCAQALYDSQGRFARDPVLRHQFSQAGQDETDHLAWTAERVRELGSRTSLLNPFWYAGAFLIGAVHHERVTQRVWVSWSKPSVRWRGTWKGICSDCQ